MRDEGGMGANGVFNNSKMNKNQQMDESMNDKVDRYD